MYHPGTKVEDLTLHIANPADLVQPGDTVDSIV